MLSGLELVHGDWLPIAAAVWIAVAGAVVVSLRLARGRRERLLGRRAPASDRRADVLLLLAWLLVGVGALGPRIGTETIRVPASGVDVVVLVDVSRSMLARDVAPSRLARARRAADELLGDLGEADRAALAAFSGRGVLLTPLTPDKDALRALLPAVDPTLITPGGSRLARGVDAAIPAFGIADTRPRVLVVLGDGEDPEEHAELGEAALRTARIRVVAAAFGSAAGAAVPAARGTLLDARGRPVVSRARPETLAQLATATDGRLLETDSAGRLDRRALLAAVRRDAPRAGAGFVERRVPILRSDACALAALVLLWIEAARLRPRRLRRRAVLAASAATLLGAAEADAPGDAGELLREGVARAERGELAEAERAFFAALSSARDSETAADAYFDLGVAALERRDYEAAKRAFFDALAVRPGDRETQYNLEWTLIAEESEAPAGGAADPDDARDEGRERPSEGREETTPDEPRPEPATEPGRDEENGERGTDAPAEARSEPRERPDRDGAAGRRNPVELDPEAAERWLQAVEDDPQRSLRTRARADDARGRRSRGPTW